MKVCSVCRRCYDDTAAVCVEQSHRELSPLLDGGIDLVDGYRLETLIETRPFVHTFKAHQEESGVRCRVRISEVDKADDFLCEAKLAIGLFHPNLAGVYDFGMLCERKVFVISEECEGQTMRDLLMDAGPPALLTTVEIVRQVAEALHSIHDAGLVHGAVRPENIVLARNASGIQARLCDPDLGGVTRKSIVSRKFLMESALDLLRYFAPEQLDAGELDAQTDVYSLGIVFYEMLSGTVPFNASTATGLIHMHRNQPPPAIRINDYNLRMLVTYALTESLHKQPRLRQSSANVLARQLRHIEQLATHSSTPPPAGTVSAPRVPATPVVIAKPSTIENSPASRPTRFVDTVGVSIEEWQELKSTVDQAEPQPVEFAVADAKVETPAVEMATDIAETAGRSATLVGEVPAPIHRRSRLKSLKRKLHEMSALVAERQAAITRLLSSVDRPVEKPAVETVESIAETVAPEKIELPEPAVEVSIEMRRSDRLTDRSQTGGKPVSKDITEVSVPTVGTQVEMPPVKMHTQRAVPPMLEKGRQPIVNVRATKPPVVAKPRTSQPTIRKFRSAKMKPPSPAMMAAVRAAARAGTVQRPVTATSNPIRPDSDEITLVRAAPPTRIRIDIERRPTRSAGPTAKVPVPEFVPTLIGVKESIEGTSDTVSQSAMFGAYYGGTRSSSLPYRSISLGVGLVTLCAVFLFGNDSIGRFFGSVPQGDSVTVKATSAEGPPVRTADVILRQPNVKQDVQAPSRSELKVSKPLHKPDETDPPKPDRQKVSTARNSKKSAAVDEKPSRKQIADQPKTDLATRPRIVRDPRPE